MKLYFIVFLLFAFAIIADPANGRRAGRRRPTTRTTPTTTTTRPVYTRAPPINEDLIISPPSRRPVIPVHAPDSGVNAPYRVAPQPASIREPTRPDGMWWPSLELGK